MGIQSPSTLPSEQTDPLKAHFTGSNLLDGSSDDPLQLIQIG